MKQNSSEHGDVILINEPLMNLYTAIFSKAKDVDTLENIINSNPTQELGKGIVIDFTVESAFPPYATLNEIRKHYPECDTFVVHPRCGDGEVLIRFEDGKYRVGRREQA